MRGVSALQPGAGGRQAGILPAISRVEVGVAELSQQGHLTTRRGKWWQNAGHITIYLPTDISSWTLNLQRRRHTRLVHLSFSIGFHHNMS